MTQTMPAWPVIIGLCAFASLFLSITVILVCKKIESLHKTSKENKQ